MEEQWMDKQSIRILEGIGYVAAIFIGAGSLIRSSVPFLSEIGLMLFGIVLVRLASIAAQEKAVEVPAAKAAAAASEETKEE
jgi:hypothetical protein